ncbi:MAG: MFS transporter [Alphaproteobacteria bacterium]|nr:MFS transporter [Alphaproteobacteria bacterium]
MDRSYGWVVVAAGIAITCLGMGGVLALGVFLPPLEAAEGWTRTQVATASMFAFLAMGVAGFGWGALSDRWGARRVVLAGGAIQGLGLVLAGKAGSVLELQLAFGVLGGIGAGAYMAPLTASASRWFERNRGLAVALVTAGMGMGTLVTAPLATWLIAAYGWRMAFTVLGLMVWAVVLPMALLLRAPPVVAASGPGGGGMTAGEALRSPALLAVAFTYFCCCAAHSGPIFHMVSYAVDCGIAPMTAATLLGAQGLAGVAGRIGGGMVADRLGEKPTILMALLLQASAIAAYVTISAPTQFLLLGMVFGLSYGAVMPLYAVLVRNWFGPAVMGTAFGAVSMAATFGMATGPVIGGWLRGIGGDYLWMYAASAAIGLGALLIATTFRAPAAPVLRTA